MYAQINYSQRLGNGPYTLAEAGCFVTAFCNLLGRFGEQIDPPTLNNYFLQHNKFIHDPAEPAGTVDDVSWGTISAYDGQVVCIGVGGAGWPDSNDAIAEFRYKGPRTGAIVTHFCLIDNAAAHTIVDSYDGVTKVSPYGTPVAWAKYERHAPVVVVPPPPAAAPAFAIENTSEHVEELKVNTHLWDLNQRTWPGLVNNPVGTASAGTTFKTSQTAHHILGGEYYLPEGSTTQGYNVVDCETPPAPAPAPIAAPVATPAPSPVSKAPNGALRVPGGKPYSLGVRVNGYLTATAAGNHDDTKKISDLAAGDYFIYNQYPNRNDLINVTKKDGTPGAWINTADNAVPPPPGPISPPVPLSEAERERIAAARSPAPPPPPPVQVPEPAPAPTGTWQDGYAPFPGPVKYIVVRDIVVQDLSGQHPDLQLPAFDPSRPNIGVVSAYGTVQKDGVDFYRLKTNNDPDFKLWYAVPKLDPATKTPLLLVMPLKPLPVSKVTLAHDTLQLTRQRLENDGLKFLDDILPKWFKNKK